MKTMIFLLSFIIGVVFPAGGCSSAPRMSGPVSAGKFFRIYNPSVGEAKEWYINDHCFVHDGEGWHLFGITHEEPADPIDEDNLAHATADRLTQRPWRKEPFALTVDEAWTESHLWAPHVVEHENLYYMYYCGGGDANTRYRIHLATSEDLFHWKRHEDNPMVVDGYDARDPFVLRDGERWIMYYTATDEPKGGHHIVAAVTSDDLIHWGERQVVYRDPSTGTWGGPTESPTVVRRGDFYYLFIGPRGDYVSTDVFVSRDPLRWEIADKVGHIDSHAAEVVRDVDGSWYVSHCGWGRGGVYLAPLYWNDNLEGQDSSLPAPSRQ